MVESYAPRAPASRFLSMDKEMESYSLDAQPNFFKFRNTSSHFFRIKRADEELR